MDIAKVVRLHAIGGPEVLQLEELPLQQPGAGEVRLKVQAIGLNRAEVMFRTGHYLEQPEFPSRIGVEAAGIVDAVGSGVTQVKIGQKVSVATGQSIGRYGTYGQSAIIPAVSALPYPDNLTPEEAASVWVQYLTAYFAFVDLGNVKPGQCVLVTAASGGAGLGAIQMARLLGATAIATTRTGAKKQALLDAGASHVIVTSEEDLLPRIKEITKGKGADLIFDPVAGDTLPVLAEAVSWGGQIILYGALRSVETPYPLWTAFARNFILRTYMVYNYCGLSNLGLPRNEEAFARATKFILQNLANGTLKPIIAKTFRLSEIREAHRYMESNQQLGKIVVTV
jgi:NADPH:quinone reductase